MNSVIKPWLVVGLVVAIAGNVMLSAVLIVKLSRFDDSKRQAEEVETRAAKQRTEFSTLQVEFESLTKKKETLEPMVVDWQKRLGEKAAAEAALAALEEKQRQTDSDIVKAGKRLEDVNRALLDADKQKTELSSTVEQLKSEVVALTKTNTDAKALARLAAEAERRLNDATSGVANADARRKQFEADAAAAQARFDQTQKEADDSRQAREKLNTELAVLRQQIQAQKDQLATFDQKAAELKALQTTAQQEEQKLAKSQQQLATVDARATEMESRQRQAASELAQLTNRLEQARSQAADLETKRNTAKTESQKAAQDLTAAQKLLAETQASQDQRAREHAALVAQVAASKKDLELARKDSADAEARVDAANAARKLSQELSAKQGELTREVSRLETTVEQLKKEKQALEKEIGRQEAQRQKTPSEVLK